MADGGPGRRRVRRTDGGGVMKLLSGLFALSHLPFQASAPLCSAQHPTLQGQYTGPSFTDDAAVCRRAAQSRSLSTEFMDHIQHGATRCPSAWLSGRKPVAAVWNEAGGPWDLE